ncbi:TonB-dependent receptor plug domain-containing protein [Deferrisoma palaeochoriense]
MDVPPPPRARRACARRAAFVPAFLILCLAFPAGALARDLTALPLEELLEIRITSAARKPQSLAEAAGPVTVITAEEIRRSGATTLPEVLRMVPGLHVGRLNANTWALSVRGFDGRWANKLLVMIDGRTVYSPLFSGVFWDAQDVLLEDVDRIEVIRGPGAALWGANAVNGVIHVVTKSAADTWGGYLEAGGGDEERGFGAVRYGGRLGRGLWGRIWAKGFDRDGAADPAGGQAPDDWSQVRGGFRLDAERAASTWTLQGEIYRGRSGAVYTVPTADPDRLETWADDTALWGGNLLGRWGRKLGAAGRFQLQAYYDRTSRDEAIGREEREAWDLDLQHRFSLGRRHDVVWGGGVRLSRDRIDGTAIIRFDPARRTDRLWNAFLQDEVALVPDHLHLILGVRAEHNNYTGAEWQPDARVLWRVTPGHTLWAGASRAVRTPSRAEADAVMAGQVLGVGNPANPLPVVIRPEFRGDDGFGSESVVSWQVGYRARWTEAVSTDLAAFLSRYRDLRTIDSRVVGPDPLHPGWLVATGGPGNRADAVSKGVEAEARWRVTRAWRLRVAYTWFLLDIDPGGSSDFSAEFEEGKTPRHQVDLRSYADLPGGWSLDLGLRYVGSLERRDIPPYWGLDARLAWEPSPGIELEIVGRDLLEPSHPEFPREDFLRLETSEPERSVYAAVRARF